jgi:hypothetical protein
MARWARTPDAAKHCGIPERTLEKWRATGGGPPFAKVRSVIVYDLDAVDRWLTERTRSSTSDPGPPAEAAGQ